jgi:hypothetical protein
MADIFISYSRAYARFTEELARDLEAEGLTTWWDTSSLLPGDVFPKEIQRAIDDAKLVIVIWTESSLASPWVLAEAHHAYGQGKLITLHDSQLNLRKVPIPFNTLHSSPVTDRAKLFKALESRGVLPARTKTLNATEKSKKVAEAPDKISTAHVDTAFVPQQPKKVPRSKLADIHKLKPFASRPPGYWPSLLLAVLTTILGFILAWYPLEGALTLTMQLTAYFIVHGIVTWIFAFSIKGETGRWVLSLLSGLIDFLLAGLVIAGWPSTALWVLGLFVGVNMLLTGFALLFAALGARSA